MSSNDSIKKVPSPMEIKTYLMVSQNKLTLYRNKKVNVIKQKRKEIIVHLKENNIDLAKAKMDTIIREEDLITCYDILGPLCEILKEKVTYIVTSQQCPQDIRAPLDTLMYASNRLEMEELHKLKELISAKYGVLYVTNAITNADRVVNKNVIDKLNVRPATDSFITIRLKQICKEENIEIDFPSDNYGGNQYQGGDGNMFNQGMDIPYNPQQNNFPSNPYGSQFNLNENQAGAGNWNPNIQGGGQFQQMGESPYNPNQFDNSHGGFNNYNQKMNINQSNQMPYGNMNPNSQADPNPYLQSPSYSLDNSNNQQQKGNNMNNPYGQMPGQSSQMNNFQNPNYQEYKANEMPNIPSQPSHNFPNNYPNQSINKGNPIDQANEQMPRGQFDTDPNNFNETQQYPMPTKSMFANDSDPQASFNPYSMNNVPQNNIGNSSSVSSKKFKNKAPTGFKDDDNNFP